MIRRLLIASAALSLLLCALTILAAEQHDGLLDRVLIVKRERIMVLLDSDGIWAVSSGRGGPVWLADGYLRIGECDWAGFTYWRAARGGERGWYLWVPYWFPVGLTAVPPALAVIWIVRARHGRRRVGFEVVQDRVRTP